MIQNNGDSYDLESRGYEFIITETIGYNGFTDINLLNKQLELVFHYFRCENSGNDKYGYHSFMDEKKEWLINEDYHEDKSMFFVFRTCLYKFYKVYPLVAFERTVNFFNELVNDLIEKKAQTIEKYTFIINDEIKNYFGNQGFWYLGSNLYNVPSVIADVFNTAEYMLFQFLDTLSLEKRKEYIKEIYNMVFYKSNNIILFPLLYDLVFKYLDCCDKYVPSLISNIDVVILDINRNIKIIGFPYQQIGLNENFRKLEKDFFEAPFRKYSIQNISLYLQATELKAAFYDVFDYLYTIVENTEENYIRYLNIKKMDLRTYESTVINGIKCMAPKLTGEAQIIAEKYDAETGERNSFIERVHNIVNSKEMIDLGELENEISYLLSIDVDIYNEFTIYHNIPILIKTLLIRNESLLSEEVEKYIDIFIVEYSKYLTNSFTYFDIENFDIFAMAYERVSCSYRTKIIKFICKLLLSNNNIVKHEKFYSTIDKICAKDSNSLENLVNCIFYLVDDELNYRKEKYDNNDMKNYKYNLNDVIDNTDISKLELNICIGDYADLNMLFKICYLPLNYDASSEVIDKLMDLLFTSLDNQNNCTLYLDFYYQVIKNYKNCKCQLKNVDLWPLKM